MFDQAYLTKNHTVNGKAVSFLEAAQIFNLGVFTSVPLLQGKIVNCKCNARNLMVIVHLFVFYNL